MLLLTPLLSLLAPHECLGCLAEGKLLCHACRSGLEAAKSRCYHCQDDTLGFSTCAECRQRTSLARVRAAVAYEATAKDLVWKLKFGRAQAAAREMADMMAPLLSPFAASDMIITHAPTATSRIRQRGYDQAALIARALAWQTGLPYAPLLVRTGQHKQVGADRSRRTGQLEGAFRPIRARTIRGAHIIMVDDVVTTGSTLQAAAGALHRAGASRVEAIVFAQA